MADVRAAAECALEALDRHLERSRAGSDPVTSPESVETVAEKLQLRRWLADGGMDAEGFAGFLERYLESSIRCTHPGFISHQVAPPDDPAGLADLVHGRINNLATTYELGPAATAVELAVVEWMLGKVGWGETGAGVCTHGGSLGNLTALLAARARSAPDSWMCGTPPDLAVLAPRAAHYSLRRAVAILGLGERAIVPVECDSLGRTVPSALSAAADEARRRGRRAMAMIANAGATSTGLYDELAPIAEFCREHRVWLHVDGAHGASVLLSARHRRLLDGVEQADSLVWDAHKMMRTSAGCTGVLFRRAEDLERTFHQQADYLIYEDEERVALAARSLEVTKAPIALKLFLNLAWRGEGGVGAYVARQYDKTRRFHQAISARPAFECPYVPQSNILCFRHRRAGDALHVRIRERLNEDGRFHIGTTQLRGMTHFRITVMSPDTDEATIEQMLDTIERIAWEPSAALRSPRSRAAG